MATHRYSSAVRSPSCEGTLPLRSFWLRDLREGCRSGIMGERRQMQRAASATRALLPARRHPPRPPTPYILPRLGGRGCRGAAAHRFVSAVRSPSCEGKLLLRLFQLRYLREGRRSGIMGGTATNAEGGKCDACTSPTRRHTLRALPLLPCHGLEAGVPRCGGSQSRQRRELAKLRGHAAAQVVALKLPARKAPEQDHGGNGDERRGWQVQRVRLPCAPPFSAPSQPLP